MKYEKQAETFRKLQKSNLPSRLEFYSEQELIEHKAMSSRPQSGEREPNSREHFIPQDLPVVQTVGSERWHPNKVGHLSAEMCLRAFQRNSMQMVCLCSVTGSDFCLRSSTAPLSVWYDWVMEENLETTWEDIRAKIVATFDTPEQKLRSMEKKVVICLMLRSY